MSDLIESRDWSSLPSDVLGKIKSYFIELDDVRKFRAVCKEWRQAFTPGDGFGSEWLLQKSTGDSTLTLLHPPLVNMSRPYCIQVPPNVRDASIHCCKDGWLLMSTDINNLFFFNPLSKSTISLPKLPPYKGEIFGFATSSSPTSNDCVVLVMARPIDYFPVDTIFTIAKGISDWTKTTLHSNGFFIPDHRNPLYHKGKFYSMDLTGYLRVFDHNSQTWMSYHDPIHFDAHGEVYLLDFDGNLTSVFLGPTLRIEVYMWNECDLKWQKVEDLGGHAFFLSKKASFAKKDWRSYMRNKIHLPIGHKESGVFYSFDHSTYDTFRHDLQEDKEPVITMLFNCCWFEPAQNHCSNESLGWISNTTPRNDC